MKTTLTLSYLFFILVFNSTVFAQNKKILANQFVRVYNLEGKKIFKGKIIAVSDTLLQLKRSSLRININPKEIGMIKTKHSEGNNVIVGSLIGASLGTIVGITSADPDAWFGFTAEEGAGVGIILGAPAGAAVGAITIPFKKSLTFIINGELQKWKEFQEAISN